MKAPGKERIYTCGEKEYLAWQARKDKGAPVDGGVQRELVAMRDDLKLPYTFRSSSRGLAVLTLTKRSHRMSNWLRTFSWGRTPRSLPRCYAGSPRPTLP